MDSGESGNSGRGDRCTQGSGISSGQPGEDSYRPPKHTAPDTVDMTTSKYKTMANTTFHSPITSFFRSSQTITPLKSIEETIITKRTTKVSLVTPNKPNKTKSATKKQTKKHYRIKPTDKKTINTLRITLTDEQRLEIIEKKEKFKYSNVKLGEEYNVGESTIRKTLANKTEILQRNKFAPLFNRKRVSKAIYPELESTVIAFVTAMRLTNVAYPPTKIQVKAMKVAEAMGISEFKASNGWLQNFMKRHGLTTMNLCGEGAEVDKNDPELLKALDEFYDVISNYHPDNIYNADETGLFYKLIPRITVLLPSESRMDTRGKKEPKDRVTLTVCSNASGTHKISLSMIGRAAKPECSRGREWPIDYVSQKNAWQDSGTFTHWLLNVFQPQIRKRTGQDVLLILDNAPSHIHPHLEGIRVEYLPANVTSWKQPMDMGIIAAFKKRYKYALLSKSIDFFELSENEKQHRVEMAKKMRAGTAGLMYGRPPHLMDVATIAKECWEAISQDTIQNCYKKASIITDWESEQTPTHEKKDDSDDAESFSKEIINNMVSLQLIEYKDIASLMEEMEIITHMDDSNAEDYINAISEEVDKILESSVIDKEHQNEEISEDQGENAENEQTNPEEYVLPDSEEIDSVVQQLKNLEIQLLSLTGSNLNPSFLTKVNSHLDSITDFKHSCEKIKRYSIPLGSKRMIQLNINDCIQKHVSSIKKRIWVEI